MVFDGNSPVIDYALRSSEEQQRLFKQGLSKCDGVTKLSNHQRGLAADIYFVVTKPDGTIFTDYDFKETFDLAMKYHDIWVEMGGNKVISWDLPHFD
jgi:hypothetical protein